MKPLSKLQLARLGLESNLAYKRLQAVGYPLPPYPTWRREFTAERCNGRNSWKALDQRDYIPLLNAFAAIHGGAQQQNRTPKCDEEAKIYAIRNIIRHWELPAAYVAKIIAGKTSRPWISADTPLDSMLIGVPANTLRQIAITLENRARALHKKECAALGIPQSSRVHVSPSTVPPGSLPEYLGDTLALPAPRPRPAPKS